MEMMKEDPKQVLSVDEALSKAKKLSKRGKYQGAFELYSLILETDPSNRIARKASKKLLPLVGSKFSSKQEVIRSKSSLFEEELNIGSIESFGANFTETEASKYVLELIGKNELDNALNSALNFLKEFTHSVSLLNLTGALYSKLGDQLSALPYLKTAASLNQESAEVWCNLGSVQNSLGDASAAIDSYQRAIKASPDEATIHFNLANCLKSLGEGELAVESYRRALELDPQYAAAFNNLGLALQSLSFFDEAAQSFREAIDLVPSYTEALLNLADNQFKTGNLDQSLLSLNRAIELDPTLAEPFFRKGNIFRDRRAYHDAADQFHKALEIDHSHFAALNNLSDVLLKCGKSAESLEAAERAIAINPNELPAPHNNRGAALKELGRYSEAIVSYKKAIEIEPEFGEGYYNIALILANICKFDEALFYYEMAIAARPDHIDVHSNKLFALNYHPTKTADEIYCNYVEFNDRFSSSYSPIWRNGDHDLSANRILRIGYLSPDFRSHSASRFLEPLFDTHDKSKFEIYAYSAVVHEDVITDYLKSRTHTWTSTLDLDDKELAEKIASDKIDILIDLAGHTNGHRLLMMAIHKPAPIQVSFMGYGYTTGIKAIDYFITDAICTPAETEHLYAEVPWKLSTNYAYRPSTDMGDVSSLPAKKNGFITFGSFSRIIRLNFRTIAAWSAILNRVEDSRLIIDSADLKFPELRNEIMEKFETLGVNKNRLELGFNSPPWDLLREIDISLDCFPHNSGLTLLESLYMGVPFVTLANRVGVGRLGASFLTAIGRDEWITESEEAFVDAALDLAKDLDELSKIRQVLRAEIKSSPIMNELKYTSELEAAYQSMWEIFLQQSC